MNASDLERKFGAKKRKTVTELKQVISTRSDNNPNFCLFLGAGASHNSGIRTAGEMVKEWRENVFKDHCPESNTRAFSVADSREWLSANCGSWFDENREYSTLIEKQFPLQTNRRKFIETEVAEKIPSIGYAYLVRLAESGLIRTIFTTNFDDLLNEAFYQFSSERALICAHDSNVNTISITSNRTKIIKLHGDYLFDDIKNTSVETNCLEDNMKAKLTEFLKEYGLILTGYSGSDKSITRILDDLSNGSAYLQNGLFWCFREDDEVTQEALDILAKPRSFFVITTGFDELMADLYTILGTKATPFSSKLASDRAANVIESYLQNASLKNTSSSIIKKHLEALESDKSASLMSDMMKDLNSDRMASSGLSDQNLLVYLEVERYMKERDPEAALARLAQELSKTDSKRFKEILLHRRYVCSIRVNKIDDAKRSIRDMLDLEPQNYFVALSEASLLESRTERVSYLKNLKEKHPFSAAVLNRYADEVRESIEANDKVPKGCDLVDAENSLKKSLQVDPSLSNPAWSELFNMYLRDTKSANGKKALREIVEKHLAQDPYCCETTSLLFNYCKKLKLVEFNGKGLFEYLDEAYTKHFPRDYAGHIRIFVRACIEFNGHRYLRPVLEEARDNEELKDDPRFAKIMMDVHFDVFRDLGGAIAHGRDYLKKHKKTSVELKLLDFCLENKEHVEAWEMHAKLKGAIDLTQWLLLEAKILEHEERFQDAIDTIERIPDRREFDERYTSVLSYLDLKMGAYGRAVRRCKEFLQKRSFPIYYEAEIINYEYGKLKDGRKVDLSRISRVRDATESESVKAVCCLLLGKEDEALILLESEAEKRFSNVFDYLKWPALSKLHSKIQRTKTELSKRKRCLNDLPVR